MKTALAFLILFSVSPVFAAKEGAEGHGGNQTKTRILWSRQIGIKILASESCEKRFTVYQCETMRKKLVRGEIVWAKPEELPLKVVLHGVEQEVTAKTTKELDSAIKIDVERASTMNALETISFMIHEAGHSVDLSDDLISDKIVIELMSEDPKLIQLASSVQAAEAGDAPSKADTDVPYYNQWCKDSVGTLLRAQSTARRSAAAAEEKEILLSGIREVLTHTHPKHQRYVMATLEAAQGDTAIYDDAFHQVLLLRRYYSFAVEDFNMLKGIAENSSLDAGPYVRQLLARTGRLAISASKRSEEILLLSRAFERAILILEGSDFRRTPAYACTARTLTSALETSSSPALSEQSKLLALRAGLKIAAATLDSGVCH